MIMLHDFLMFIGGTILGGLVLTAFSYLMFDAIKAKAYWKGYEDGWRDAEKEARKYK
jgi:hypothetical protein